MRKIIFLIIVLSLSVFALAEENIFTNISANQAERLLKDKNIVVLDIRTKEEFDAGYIKGAVNIDYYKPDFKSKLNTLDKNKTYFVYCRSGRRSGNAEQIFVELGFKKVYNLEKGINEWIANKKELVYNVK